MHRHDGLGARSDELFDLGGVKAKGSGVDIGEDGVGADTFQRVASGDKGERSRYHIAASEAHGIVAEFQGECSVVEECQIRLRHAEIFRECLLELLQHRPVVREPLVGPYLLASPLEILNRRQIRSRDQYRFLKSFHKGYTELFQFCDFRYIYLLSGHGAPKKQVRILTFWLIPVNGGGRELVRVGVRVREWND